MGVRGEVYEKLTYLAQLSRRIMLTVDFGDRASAYARADCGVEMGGEIGRARYIM